MSPASQTADHRGRSAVDPPDPSPTTPRGRRERTRQALLDAAGELFAKQGVERTTVEEIADSAGLSVGSIYKHFANKEALAVAFVDESLTIAEAYLRVALAADTPVERLTQAGDAYFRFARENAAACRFAIMRSFDPSPTAHTDPIDRAMSKRIQRILLTIATDLKAAMDAGLMRRLPVDEAMIFIWGAWSGVTHLVLRQDPMQIPAELGERSLALGRTLLIEALGLPSEAAAT